MMGIFKHKKQEILESMWGIKDWPDNVTEKNSKIYSWISDAIRNKEKILVFYNEKYLGRFELLAGDEWFFYKRSNGKRVDEQEIKDYFYRFLYKDIYSISAKKDPTLSIQITKNKQVEEMTVTGGASGSYQTPFQIKENKNMKKDTANLIEINEEQFNKIVKNILLKEFVYSSSAASATNSNTKGKPTKSTASTSIKNAEANMKPNMEDERPPNVKNINDQGKQDEDSLIEREAGGMQDLEYDSLPDKAKENFKKQFTAGDNARTEKNIGNATGDTTIGKDMLARAKKRKDSKDASVTPLIALGDDIEVDKRKVKQKATMAENIRIEKATSKKYRLKDNSFLTEKFVDEYLTKYRKFYEGKNFFLEDKYGNRAKVNWIKKFPILEGIINVNKQKRYYSLQEQLFKGDIDNSIYSSKLNEHEIFVQMFKQAKSRKPILNED